MIRVRLFGPIPGKHRASCGYSIAPQAPGLRHGDAVHQHDLVGAGRPVLDLLGIIGVQDVLLVQPHSGRLVHHHLLHLAEQLGPGVGVHLRGGLGGQIHKLLIHPGAVPGALGEADAGDQVDVTVGAAQSLEEGQWSGILEADDGFYLILRKPVDLEAVAPDYFDALLQAAADSAEVSVSKAYERLSARQFYDALTAGRSALENPSSEQTADS